MLVKLRLLLALLVVGCLLIAMLPLAIHAQDDIEGASFRE